MVKVIFITGDGARKELTADAQSTLLRVAQAGGIDMEGACEGSMACSTCHVVVDADWYPRLPAASAAEEDMLDLTYGVTRTSRLGCQITVTPALDGLVVKLPPTTRNMMNR